MRLHSQALLTVALLCGCVSRSAGPASLSNAFQLSERTSADGVRTRFRVQPDRSVGPSILRVETRSSEIAYLGLNARSLDRAYAQTLGIEPWRGVSITAVGGESAARAAGLQSGDVLVSLAGEELGSVEEFEEVVRVLLRPGVAVPAVRLRKDSAGQFVEQTFEITPGARTIEDSTTERIGLEAPDEIVERTGMQVTTIEADLARELGLGDQSQALVTSVVVGAAAYEQGIRGGDRILECNGAPVASAADVLEVLRSGASHLELFVAGPLGEHRAGVGASEDVDARRRFHIPIVIDYTSRADRTRTSFLDFIFQFGFNYRRTAYDSDTREPFVDTYFSLFPLGMFEFERSPKRSRTTLFWFITWSTGR